MLNRLFANPDVGFKNGVRACAPLVPLPLTFICSS